MNCKAVRTVRTGAPSSLGRGKALPRVLTGDRRRAFRRGSSPVPKRPRTHTHTHPHTGDCARPSLRTQLTLYSWVTITHTCSNSRLCLTSNADFPFIPLTTFRKTRLTEEEEDGGRGSRACVRMIVCAYYCVRMCVCLYRTCC